MRLRFDVTSNASAEVGANALRLAGLRFELLLARRFSQP
jgi:hypothetical protein